MSSEIKQNGFVCAVPSLTASVVKLGHGSGGRMSAQLLSAVFLPHLQGQLTSTLDDATLAPFAGQRIVVTTDSYVVKPVFFPGGDIGSLAVHGTVNDIACRGAKPLFITASFILEEGLPVELLERIVFSMAEACKRCGVSVIAGDTKVVNKGAGDQVYIATTGIGQLLVETPPGADRAQAGDVVILTGDVGRHGMAVMCAREGIDFDSEIRSDSAPLHLLVERLLSAGVEVHTVRDLTRGGLASALNEIAASSNVGIEIDEKQIVLDRLVHSACELLGLDPLYVACEGRMAIIVPADAVEVALATLQSTEEGRGACAVGTIVPEHPARVIMRTKIGGRRIVDMLSGEQLPRIC